MSSKPHSRWTLWRNYFCRTLPVLGPTARRTRIEAMRQASTIILQKRDNIGDFVLATTFFNVAYRQWCDREVTLVCTPAAEELVRLLYPKWQIRVVPVTQDPAHFQCTWRTPSELQKQVRGWPQAELMINLRSIRHQHEVFFDSWVPAVGKLTVENQFCYQEGEYIKVPDRRVYSRTVAAVRQATPTVCKDIANHRALIRGLFPEINAEDCWPVLDLGGQAEVLASMLVAKGVLTSDCLILVPFPSDAIKRYPEDKLVRTVSSIARKYDLGIAIVGGAKDREEGDKLSGKLSAPKGIRNLAGALTLLESAVAIKSARLVVGVDTGPIHIAIAGGVPTVVLLGGGHYGTFGPWGDPRRARWLSHPMPCYDCSWLCSQPEPYCVRSIDPALIESAAEEVLRGTGRGM